MFFSKFFRFLGTNLSHGVDGGFAQFVREVIAFDKADAMLPCDGAFHLHRALDHSMHHGLGGFALFVVEEDDCCAGLASFGVT